VHQAGSGAGRAGLRAEKAALRARLLAARAQRPDEDRAAAARLNRDHVLSLPEAQMAGTVAAYFSVGAEPDTRGLVYALWKRGTYVILPLLRPDGDLDWASYEGPDSLAPGPRGLLEPTEAARGVDAVARASLVLAPALAVDRHGNRLGRGGASFDRALARVGAQVPVVALLHDGELLERVPAEPHDRPVGLVALPSRGIVTVQIPLRRSATISTRITRVLASRHAAPVRSRAASA
jgi:5-formyltetrahydrofolate cyclo-ligase